MLTDRYGGDAFQTLLQEAIKSIPLLSFIHSLMSSDNLIQCFSSYKCILATFMKASFSTLGSYVVQ